MMKKFIVVLFAFSVTLVMFATCENPLSSPTGIYTPAGGMPGGGKIGGNFGVPDPSYTGYRFDASSFATMPSVAVWNSLGHQHAFPDLFHFANGNRVVTKEDWEARQEEISHILQYYEYGIMPPLEEAEGVHIEFSNIGGANTHFTVTYRGNPTPYEFDIETILPGTQVEADRGHLGVSFVASSPSTVNWSGGTGNFVSNGFFAQEIDASGPVRDLFNYDITRPDSPSANMYYAWGWSVILTGMEGIDFNEDGEIDPESERAFRGWYDPNKLAIQGYSRTGKAAEVVAAFARGRKGSRVGHVAIGSAGSGGPALERFISPSGYKVNGIPADPLPIGQDGIMDYRQLQGKSWFLKKMVNGDNTLGDGPVVAASNGIDDIYRYRTVRGWSPYFESYERTPLILAVGNLAYEDTTPFVGWQANSTYYAGNQGYWGGIQNLSESRNETPGWFSVRFREFQDLHYGLDMDHVTGNEFRPPYGLLCTIPFDQHYLSALIAPRGILLQDGLGVPRNNPDSQFANWVITDEVFKFLGEMEGNEYKYIWRSGTMFTLGQHTLSTGNEGPDRNYHATLVFKDYDAKLGISGGEELPSSGTIPPHDYHLFKLRDPLYQIDDPLGRFDYYRINWGRPGHPSVADRVKRRLPNELIAAYEADEIHRPAPWTYGSTSYTINSNPNRDMIPNPPRNGDGILVPSTVTVDYDDWHTIEQAPNIPRFKPMDWRGLIDEPDPLD